MSNEAGEVGVGAKAANGLRSVRIQALHGKFTYEIDLGAAGSDPTAASRVDLFTVSENRLTLLYGNNGTGKTSLLRTLFHALSSAPKRGHRSSLLGTQFQRLDVELIDGSRVSYVRPNGEMSGGFRAEVQVREDEPVEWDFKLNRQKDTEAPTVGSLVSIFEPGAGEESSPEQRFLEALSSLEINPVLLGDSRSVTADVLEDEMVRGRAKVEEMLARRGRGLFDVEEALSAWRIGDVEDALERARAYLSQLVFAGTRAGSQRVDSVYVNVASAIVEHASTVGRPKKHLLPSLLKRVEQIATRAKRYDAYGLLPAFPGSALEDKLRDAPQKNGPLLQHVLDPYLDGFEQRMDALEPGLNAISAFIDAVNSFLERKHAEFGLARRGIRILDDTTGEPLGASELSSGEKQIVLLFSDIVALQGETALFIIDEPELSLNPEWQRKLMPALLAVTEQSGMQLLAATHSIEIMARYRDRIRRLGE